MPERYFAFEEEYPKSADLLKVQGFTFSSPIFRIPAKELFVLPNVMEMLKLKKCVFLTCNNCPIRMYGFDFHSIGIEPVLGHGMRDSFDPLWIQFLEAWCLAIQTNESKQLQLF